MAKKLLVTSRARALAQRRQARRCMSKAWLPVLRSGEREQQSRRQERRLSIPLNKKDAWSTSGSLTTWSRGRQRIYDKKESSLTTYPACRKFCGKTREQ